MFTNRSVKRPAAVAMALLGAAVCARAQTGTAALEREFARIAEAEPGMVGVAAVHMESGAAAYLNGSERFPMASTYKVAIAAELLRRVDAGDLSLDTMVEVKARDISPGSGMISQRLTKPGVSLSVRNLLDLMLTISDNSATDLCLGLAGGGGAVTSNLRRLGVKGVRVDRSTLELIADFVGIPTLPPRDEYTIATYRAAYGLLSAEAREAAVEAFQEDERDTATPEGMARLLWTIWSLQALSAESTALLKDTMFACETGEGRIKGMLPPHVRVAHKTGTLDESATNDVGVMVLPEEAGHVAMAVFVKNSEGPVENRERIIAQTARAAYDYFMFANR